MIYDYFTIIINNKIIKALKLKDQIKLEYQIWGQIYKINLLLSTGFQLLSFKPSE